MSCGISFRQIGAGMYIVWPTGPMATYIVLSMLGKSLSMAIVAAELVVLLQRPCSVMTDSMVPRMRDVRQMSSNSMTPFFSNASFRPLAAWNSRDWLFMVDLMPLLENWAMPGLCQMLARMVMLPVTTTGMTRFAVNSAI